MNHQQQRKGGKEDMFPWKQPPPPNLVSVFYELTKINQKLKILGEHMSTVSTDLSNLQAAADANQQDTAQIVQLTTTMSTQITALQNQVTALQAQGAVSPTQLAQIETIVNELGANNTTLSGLVAPSTPTTPSAPPAATPSGEPLK